MMPETVVCWRWPSKPGYRSVFGPEQVNVLRRMVARNYPHPHRFLCVCEDSSGLDREVEAVPSWNDFADLPSPHGDKNPSCYRRLRMFHPDIASVLGKRFVSLDLDMVITGDLTPVWDRPEAIVLVGDTNPKTYYNGSMILMTSGCRPQVWIDFDPVQSPKMAKAAGLFGSDQAWISHCLGPNEAKWGKADGVYSYRNEIARLGNQIPTDAKVIVCHGANDPWMPPISQTLWAQEAYQ